jgi:SulP family sulfate permease
MTVSEVRDLLSAGFAVAVLAAIESLLSAKVADGMGDVGRHDPDRELFGQGLANLVSPLFGGMPATGAIARTAVNVRAGARTRAAAAIHSVVLVLVALFAGGLVSEIPLAALAGVLMVTAWRMVEVHNVRAVARSTRSDAVVLIATTVATVAFDLILAIEIGVAVAAMLALRQVALNSEAEREALPVDELLDISDEARLLAEHIVVYRIDGALFFGAAQRFLTELTAVSDVRVMILRLSQMQSLDATGAHALGEIVEELEGRGITVLLKGARPNHRRILESVGTLDRLAHERHLFEHLDDAIAHAHLHLSRAPHPTTGLPASAPS